MLLAVLRRTVIDVEFAAAIPEVVEDLAADPPVAGESAVAEVAEESHEEVAKTFLEPSIDDVAKNIAAGVPDLDYYDIKFNMSMKPSLKAVREKSGTRASAPAEEIIVIENADGDELGSTSISV